MCSFRSASAAVALLLATTVCAQPGEYPGIGRKATDKEVAAWDIDVRPDFKGLPKGSGSVTQGQALWEERCASCHGVFGESNEVFQPLVGGTTADDVKRGRAARLTDASFPGRTTLMKLSTVSTLWDYINRAMPWNAPKSLKTDEVYAVTAFLLNLGGVVPDDFVLSDATMAQAQRRLPNRAGTTMAHALWPGANSARTAPDVRARACQRDCVAEPKVASLLPDHARNAHGNLAEQNRAVGAQRGIDTARPADDDDGIARKLDSTTVAVKPAAGASSAWALAGKHGCTACHGLEGKLIGPGFRDVGRKHAARDDAVVYLQDKIRSGGAGAWGTMPMPPQNLPESDARTLAQWIAQGARQ
ncbi:MAG: c-type cytochrome [Burkholderiaceae bacterium]|nr:c-type cytochrome [Burkholderiaceae bacterium]